MADRNSVLKWAHLGLGRNPRDREIIEEERRLGAEHIAEIQAEQEQRNTALHRLDPVVRAMVTVNRWGGDGDELAFNSETLTLLFRREAIAQLVELLPAPVWLSLIKKNVLSPGNQGNFARASVKSVDEMLSS